MPPDSSTKRKAEEIMSQQKPVECSSLKKRKALKSNHKYDFGIKEKTDSSTNMPMRSHGKEQETLKALAPASVFQNPDRETMKILTRKFNADDLNYLRDFPTIEPSTGALHDTESFFKSLWTYNCKNLPPNHQFWIPRENVDEFLMTYRFSQSHADRMIRDNRETKKELGDTILKLSNQWLDLNRYATFFEIITYFQKKLNSWLDLKKTYISRSKIRYDTTHFDRKVEWILEGATLWYYTSEAILKYWRERYQQEIEPGSNSSRGNQPFKLIQMMKSLGFTSKESH
ncbi:uncharacterized protein PGTG_15949 [Puccinia graminis f. sp. tritici CRL 75-36-700-3]|uniref:Uncharacterized protein n=1 Tax=Puccinia graminis f. sp. tritici (strain CRL 75-36-700-3 / race SCCL) TaxID=418459 RepID=E3L0P7_PUCGT|nr:uncharacterized protein PGTG_15949 [Puccinia graminis f. sp. tritici CRL 75-36-700-3]EFP90101.1 hypothetical protein PGTG_15949 [Puccinia graminis f. sp. tritici CRL 75-36-700-3]